MLLIFIERTVLSKAENSLLHWNNVKRITNESRCRVSTRRSGRKFRPLFSRKIISARNSHPAQLQRDESRNIMITRDDYLTLKERNVFRKRISRDATSMYCIILIYYLPYESRVYFP